MGGWASGSRLAEFGHKIRCFEPVNPPASPDCEPSFAPVTSPGSMTDGDPENPDSCSIHESVQWSDVVFIRLPPGCCGKHRSSPADTGFPAWFEFLVPSLQTRKLLVILCRAPDRLLEGLPPGLFSKAGDGSGLDVVFQVSFESDTGGLAAGSAPGALVFGAGRAEVKKLVRSIYPDPAMRLIFTDQRTAEMVQLAGNAMVATHTALFQTLAPALRSLDVDARIVVEALERNLFFTRLGFSGGTGFDSGGHRESLKLLLQATNQKDVGDGFLQAVADSWDGQITGIIERLETELGSLKGRQIGCVGVADWSGLPQGQTSIGLSFCQKVLEQGAKLIILEPQSRAGLPMPPGVQRCSSNTIEELVQDSDALVVFAPSQPLRSLDLAGLKSRMKRPLVVDLVSFFDPAEMKALGFEYLSIP